MRLGTDLCRSGRDGVAVRHVGDVDGYLVEFDGEIGFCRVDDDGILVEEDGELEARVRRLVERIGHGIERLDAI